MTASLQKGIVKQVVSGDTIFIRGQPKNGPPPEKRLRLSNVTAPKIARRETPNIPGCEDEPYAWESREFLRRKLIGKEISFIVDYKVNTRDQEFGTVFLTKDSICENINELMVSEGLVQAQRSAAGANDEVQIKFGQLEDAAKVSKKGMWSDEPPNDHIRKIEWNVENPRHLVDLHRGKPVNAVIEHVRDGCTIRAFLLPSMQYITLMMSGIKCPMLRPDDVDPPQFAAEAKFYVESRLLQREVQIILEGVSNQNLIGTVLHPNGNIAELLLKDGFAKCVDWSMGIVSSGTDKLRAAEKYAKDKRIRVWKDYTPSTASIAIDQKDYIAKVMEIAGGDCLMVVGNDQKPRKIFLSSLKPPRLAADAQPQDNKRIRPLYDIPYMYEAREFLRKKLIGKKVNVTVDYIQPAAQGYPEKTCCTVTASGVNVAEALISKGLATVIRHRQDDDHRSAHYDALLTAEAQAQKKNAGMHSKKDRPTAHRVADLAGDVTKSKQFLPSLQRAGKTEAVVEFVASGSRVRLYMTKENCLATLLLAGIECPRAARPGPGGSTIPGEEYGEEALALTKERCLQRDVHVEVESMDKGGNFIGWLFVDGVNQSVSLVEEGLAKVHFTAERTSHYRALTVAEERAKNAKLNLWSKYVEPKKEEIKDDVVERTVEYTKVVVTEVADDLTFYVQHVETGAQLENLMEKLRLELDATPPLPGAYTAKKGDMCAAKFEDGQWYRARVEKVDGKRVSVLYIDFGNREDVNQNLLASLSGTYQTLAPQAHQCQLALTAPPDDEDYLEESIEAMKNLILDRQLSSNVEYKNGAISCVTLYDTDSKEDMGQTLVADGYLLAENRRERRLQKLVSEYSQAQQKAKQARKHIWQYGDFRADDAKEFGYSR